MKDIYGRKHTHGGHHQKGHKYGRRGIHMKDIYGSNIYMKDTHGRGINI